MLLQIPHFPLFSIEKMLYYFISVQIKSSVYVLFPSNNYSNKSK